MNAKQILGLAAVVAAALVRADSTVTMQGKLAVEAPATFEFAPRAALSPWQMMDVTGGFDTNPDGSRNFTFVCEIGRASCRERV